MAYLPFQMNHLTEEMMERAEKELGETNEKRKEALIEMRYLIKEDYKLNCPVEDMYLLQYLRARKFNLKRAMASLQNCYHMKKKHKDIFGKKDYEAVMKVCREKMCIVLPYRDADGAIFMVIQPRYWNPDEMNFATFIHALACMVIGCVDFHPATQICGMKFVIDVKGLGINHLIHMSPRIVHLVAKVLSNILPVRLRAFHVFNESIVVKYAWNLVRLVLSEKLRKRVHFHASSLESLHSKVDPVLLPESLGGTLVYDNSHWVKVLEEHEYRYLELMSCGYSSKKNSREEKEFNNKST